MGSRFALSAVISTCISNVFISSNLNPRYKIITHKSYCSIKLLLTFKTNLTHGKHTIRLLRGHNCSLRVQIGYEEVEEIS